MKKNFTQVVAVLTAIVLLYASCKKTGIKTKADTTDFKTVSGQIATTFYQSITGQYGSVDVSKGIKSPFKVNAAHKGLVLNDVPSLCGFVIDTTYNYHTFPPPGHVPSITDTGKTYFGKFHFVYTCLGGAVNGYNIADSISYNESGFNFSNTNILTQKYFVRALDQTYNVVSMDGSLKTFAGRFKTFSEIGYTFEADYFLAGLRVDFSSGVADVVAGTTSFHFRSLPLTSVAQQPHYTDYYGTIEYLGNHKAKITFNPGSAYMVDLITGVATPV